MVGIRAKLPFYSKGKEPEWYGRRTTEPEGITIKEIQPPSSIKEEVVFWDLWINLGSDLMHLPILENLTFNQITKLIDALHYRQEKTNKEKDEDFVDTKKGKIYQKHMKYMTSL